MKNNYLYIIWIWVLVGLCACEEARRFEISADDSVPPATPVFLRAEPLNGGARIFYGRPADEDLLSIEASYTNADGKTLRFAASYFTDSLDVIGFGSAGDYQVSLWAVDRAGNRSQSQQITVTSLESPVSLVAQSVLVLPSFGSMMIGWNDLSRASVYVYVDFSYVQNGSPQGYVSVFASNQSELRTIDSLKLFNREPVNVKVRVEDKYGNSAQAKDTTIVLLTDEKLPKEGWTLPPAGTEIGGVRQCDGLNLPYIIDGLTEEDILKNFFVTEAANPWNILIDLGGSYELSRILTHQRYSWTDNSFRGAYYRGENVLAYNMYIWDEETGAWEIVSRHSIYVPLVKQEADYVTLGHAGDMAYLYPGFPQFSKPTRYFRLEAITGRYISEITLFGRKP
ncbi:MAG: DUF4959 domain-containing protein [Tannerella sp.]|jgi:hypothetical protein|nr:DUF4959 domain-containing protein [Tannerella sp.]